MKKRCEWAKDEPTLYYFLEIGIEPYLASLISEIISTALYMITVTVFLRKTKTF